MIYLASTLTGDTNAPELWLLAVASVASALTPYMAYKFRERRAKRPKNAPERLFAYYENYIDRLETALAKKDLLIDKLTQQIRDQRMAFEKTIRELEEKVQEQIDQLDLQQKEIDRMKKDVGSIKTNHAKAHATIRDLKKKALDK